MNEHIDVKLIESCFDNNGNLVEMYLKNGANPDYNNGQAFLISVDRQNPRILKLLIDYGGKSHKNNDSILENALIRQNYDCSRILIQNGSSYKSFENSITINFINEVTGLSDGLCS